jgi:hypothetical protein
MRLDIVLAEGNEKGFAKRAAELGLQGLLIFSKRKFQVFSVQGLSIAQGLIVEHKPKPGLTIAEKPTRHTFEKLRPSIVFGTELQNAQDKTHFRRSGLDDVVCRLAKQHNIMVGLGPAVVLRAPLPESVVIGRMMQNIRFCRRFGVKLVLASFAKSPDEMRAHHDLKAFGISLGMTPEEAKAASFSEWL